MQHIPWKHDPVPLEKIPHLAPLPEAKSVSANKLHEENVPFDIVFGIRCLEEICQFRLLGGVERAIRYSTEDYTDEDYIDGVLYDAMGYSMEEIRKHLDFSCANYVYNLCVKAIERFRQDREKEMEMGELICKGCVHYNCTCGGDRRSTNTSCYGFLRGDEMLPNGMTGEEQ